MTTSSRSPRRSLTQARALTAGVGGLAVLVGALLTGATGAAASTPAPVEGVLLPTTVPLTQPVAISETGFVAGNGTVLDDGGSAVSQATRWVPTRGGGYREQVLPIPAGAVAPSTATAVNDLGEVSGSVQVVPTSRALRWHAGGRASTWLAPADSSSSAGSDTGWSVSTSDPDTGAVALARVARNGTSTPLPLPTGWNAGSVSVTALAPDGAAVLDRLDFFGGLLTSNELATVRSGVATVLPVTSTKVSYPRTACTTQIGPRHTLAYSGISSTGTGTVFAVRDLTTGTDRPLPTDGLVADLACGLGAADGLASDGGVTAVLASADNSVSEAGYWNPAGRLTVIPRLAGEPQLRPAGIARGGRVLLYGADANYVGHAYLWKAGVRRELTVPAGWTLLDLNGLTDRGDALGTVRNDADTERAPIVWHTGG